MFEFRVPLNDRSYSVVVGRGASANHEALKAIVDASTKVFLITNRTIWRIYSRVIRSKEHAASAAIPLLIPDGERFKNLDWYETLCRKVVRHGADRESSIIALGGGVVGDIAGFVAATVLRGLRLVQLPTTLLSQIDSSIGGKTAVNLPEGKNMVGAFYQPSLVVADPLFLKTLPVRELRAGIYEAVKCGVVLDRPLFELLESRMKTIVDCDLDAIEEVIGRCVSAKAEIVKKDERESGPRKFLNFGHTVGHALEAATGYRRFKHGEAVGWGSLVALRVAEEMSLVTAADCRRMIACVRSVGRLPTISDLSVRSVLSHMQHDKKAVAGALQFILPTGIGVGKAVDGIDVKLIRTAYLEIRKESRAGV
jgi:3-dehydroquinate synthase